MPKTRRQATLFLDVPLIESIRQQFNPCQAELISAHVTLCREDEVEDWAELETRISDLPSAVNLEFGVPVRDSDLVYMPGFDKDGSFRSLRKHLLNSDRVRDHEPHVTLIHPRNGRCTDDAWETIGRRIEPFAYTFHEVSFILQLDGGVWQTIDAFPLKC